MKDKPGWEKGFLTEESSNEAVNQKPLWNKNDAGPGTTL